MLKFTKGAIYIPDPARPQPLITEHEKVWAAERPPQPVPFHCKPWLDGQTIGWTLFYGYLTPVTIIGLEDGKIEVENLNQLARETNQPKIISQFAPHHFGLGAGYTLQTAPGMVSLIIPATQPPAGLQTLTAVIESDWYPRQIFLVFRSPAPGVKVQLDYGAELARVIPIPRQENLEAQPLGDEARKELQEQEAAYLAEEKTTPARWTAASGEIFTHLYKIWSRRFRRKEQ